MLALMLPLALAVGCDGKEPPASPTPVKTSRDVEPSPEPSPEPMPSSAEGPAAEPTPQPEPTPLEPGTSSGPADDGAVVDDPDDGEEHRPVATKYGGPPAPEIGPGREVTPEPRPARKYGAPPRPMPKPKPEPK